MFRRVLSLATMIFCTLHTAAYAQHLVVQYSNGTGFFVSKDGHIITNHHVVKSCFSIEVDGAAKGPAILVKSDPARDLAILKIAQPSPMVAPLRWNLDTLRVGDKVSVIGYPGQLRYGTSHITQLNGPEGTTRWVQIAPVLNHGNSGGPLLDSTGNVIGVVTGKIMVDLADSSGATLTSNTADVAVTLAELKGFLEGAGVHYYQSASGMLTYADGYLGDHARRFVVQVRCVTGIN